MQTYQVETVITEDGVLHINGLPLHPGEKVQVTIKSGVQTGKSTKNLYPLRGKPVNYKEPFASVAGDDWDVMQ